MFDKWTTLLRNARLQLIAARVTGSDLAAETLRNSSPAEMGQLFGNAASKHAARLITCVSVYLQKQATSFP